MTVLRKYLHASIAAALVFSSCQAHEDDYLTRTDVGVSAIADLEVLENHDKVKEDGTKYTVASIEELPTRVKPGAIIKIKKERVDPQDTDRIVVIRDVLNPQTGSSIIIEDATKNDGYYTIKVPENSRSLEIEMLFLMASRDEKYKVYSYWPKTHTFEVEQDGEQWVF